MVIIINSVHICMYACTYRETILSEELKAP